MRVFPDQFLCPAIKELGTFKFSDGKAMSDVIVCFFFTQGDNITLETNSLRELSQFVLS